MIKLTLPFLFSFSCIADKDNCYPSEGIDEGTAELIYNDEVITYNGAWLKTGSSLQISLDSVLDDTLITIRLMASTDGIPVDEMEPETEYQLTLGNSDSATATFYPPGTSGISSTVEEASPGLFTINSIDDQVVTGCFSFTSVDQQGNAYLISNGLLHATKSDLNQ